MIPDDQARKAPRWPCSVHIPMQVMCGLRAALLAYIAWDVALATPVHCTIQRQETQHHPRKGGAGHSQAKPNP